MTSRILVQIRTDDMVFYVYIINFEYISHLFIVFLLLTLNK